MNVAIKPEFQQFVEDLVRDGRFPSPDDVIQAGLQLLQDRQANLDDIRAKVAVGLEQARRGELVDGEEAFDEIFGSIDKSDAGE